ncbi:mycothiol synthase [Nocardioides campestrisoli]|uniref:mycothiol synthase n=1 Tax=Nocardioides campestrisoli TaxID=2736757 RepID=UPI0015E6E960|nr:mycothiol synthase [Nocardioides campestrisoli]
MPFLDALVSRAEAADGVAPFDEATLMDLRAGRVTTLQHDGCVALVRGEELSLLVDPPVRGRGLGGAMAEQVLAEHPEVSRAWSHGNHPAAAALAARLGWRRVRDLWVMRLPGGAAGSVAPVDPPAGIVVRSWRPEDRDELLRVNAAAFASHPEQGAMDADNLAARMSEPWFDPAGLIVAISQDEGDDGRMLGFHWTKRHSAELGEVYVVAVDPAAQGRGLGKLLTQAGLAHLAEGGVRETILYVEADNTAAVATYTGLGFTHADADTHVMYAR